MGGCCGEGIPSCERVFDRRTAESDLRRFQKDGPSWATSELVDSLARDGLVDGASVIDIGAGIGAVHIALLERGAARALDVDGSSAYLELAREESERRGLGDRVRYFLGDVTVLAPTLEPVDLVALDRVICCYGNVVALVAAAASLARRRIGLVYPRDRWWIRVGATFANPLMFRRSGGYRMHIHREATVAALLGAAGFEPAGSRNGHVWRVETWERAGAGTLPAT